MASTSTITYQDTMESQYLSSSLSSLSRSRTSNTLIVRAYKQATQLYLTRRFKESLETLEPVIVPQHDPAAGPLTDDEYSGGESFNTAAPIAQSSRGTRTKVWVFYLSLLHAIIELGAEEGKLIFGSTRWKQLATKAREGSVWEEVVQRGYGGDEGAVDPDVVVNLATLLLGHMQDQHLNQQRLETYLSAAPDAHLMMLQEGIATPMSNGTSSPKELTTRLKILELFTLHVLPANNEWEYAEQFIEMSDMLDEERREAFLHALQGVRDEKDVLVQREEELKEMRERELEEQRAVEEQRRKDEARREEERRKAAAEAEKEKQKSSQSPGGTGADAGAQPGFQSTTRPPPSMTNPGNKATTGSRNNSSKSPSSKPPAKPSSNDNILIRASAAFSNLQHMILQAGKNASMNNAAMMRLLIFVIAFLILVARRDLRDRLKRTLNDGWIKVKQTVGMGVKVSYI